MTDRFVTLDIDNDGSSRRKRNTTNNVGQVIFIQNFKLSIKHWDQL